MRSENAKKGIILVLVILLVFGIVFGIMSLTKDLGKTQEVITQEDADQKLAKLYSNITVETKKPIKSSVDLTETDLKDELPSIEKYPLSVKNTTETYIEIFSSPEKAGEGKDGWLNEVATNFNKEKFVIDGKKVSVSVRCLASGLATDYITSGKYTPDAFTPSNTFWGEMVSANNIKIEMIEPKLAGNVAGIVVSNEKYDELISKYGSINMKTITTVTESGD
jgi:Ca-activated chloride channel family protein